MRAVQFGAGNIGRGFIGQLLYESGFEICFVDAIPGVVDALNLRGGYPIDIVGDNPERVNVTGVSAIMAHDVDAIATAIAGADVCGTSVGVMILPRIAPALAAGIERRFQNRLQLPLNILVLENQMDADDVLRTEVMKHLSLEAQQYCHDMVGFVLCVVSRMVPVMTDEQRAEDALLVRVEAYKRLPVKASRIKGELPVIVGVEPSMTFQGHEERKLYIHNASHAMFAYLGYPKGYEFIWQCVQDREINTIVRDAMDMVGRVLVAHHGFTPEDQQAYLDDLLSRFCNKQLGDSVARVGRDPLRKLRPNDRLVGAMRLLEREGKHPVAFYRTIAAAMRFAPADDESAQLLQAQIAADGAAVVLERQCAIRPAEPAGQAILELLSHK
ncbi:MAG: mannitol dehydrogenase family protein [Armatimonadota bacterium]